MQIRRGRESNDIFWKVENKLNNKIKQKCEKKFNPWQWSLEMLCNYIWKLTIEWWKAMAIPFGERTDKL